MPKLMNKVYKNSVWIIIGLSLLAYFAYRVLEFDGEIGTTLTNYQTYVQLLFVIFININMVSGAYDGGTNNGISSPEFCVADSLNNKLITSVNNEMADFRHYIKVLNHHELITIQEDYLFKVGDKLVKDLTEKELKEYNHLKPVRHNIYGFNLPLYYAMTKSGEIDYQASVKIGEGKRKKQIRKIFTGALFGAMTINMIFAAENMGNAFWSLLIISVGLVLTFIMTYMPQVFKFKVDIPKKVILKNTLYNGYINFKNGTHVLKKLEEDIVKNEEDTTNDNADVDVIPNELLKDD